MRANHLRSNPWLMKTSRPRYEGRMTSFVLCFNRLCRSYDNISRPLSSRTEVKARRLYQQAYVIHKFPQSRCLVAESANCSRSLA